MTRELRTIRAARRFTDFAPLLYPRWEPAAHLRILAENLEAVERGDITRLIVTMPPRHGKTWTASHLFPAWFLGRNPGRYVITATYAQEFADDIGRAVRNIIADPLFGEVFPGVRLADDNQSIRRFATNLGGSYFAAGAGGPITGRGADLLLIDDPIKGREDADSESMRRQLRDWYTSVAYSRLMPGGRIVLIQCLAGDTLITMEDGRRKRLDAIRLGDRVISWNGQRFVGNFVSALVNNGRDQTYLVRTNGAEVRANARHPFLVLGEKGMEWVRVRDLMPGMRIVRYGTAHTRTPCAALPGVTGEPNAEECAPPIMGGKNGRPGTVRRRTTPRNDWRCGGSDDTGSVKKSSTNFSPLRAAYAPYAGQTEVSGALGIGSPISFQTTTTKLGGSGACFATIATESPDELAIPRSWSGHSNTFEIDTDEVISVDLGHVEDVYDLTVGGDHNFVANGLVAHNTRWRADDLAGWVQQEHAHEGWSTVDFPAILPSGKPLWGERYGLEALDRIKRTLPSRDWNALYMQKPVADEGGIIKRHWWQRWKGNAPPVCDHIVISLDTAFSTKDTADYSAMTVWGWYRTGDSTDATKAPKELDNIVLLDAWRDRVDYPDLRAKVKALVKQYDPDTLLIEAKASGQSLIQELRRAGVPVVAYTPDRDKVARAYAVQSMFESGCVWAPEKPFADMVIDECAAFPTGSNDDLVDCTTQALIRFRRAGMVRLTSDPLDDDDMPKPRALRAGKSYYA